MLDERDPSIIRSPAAGRHAALAERRIAHRFTASRAVSALLTCGTWMPCTPMSNSRRMKPGRSRGAHDRGDPDALGRHNRELYIVQIVGGVLHVDKGGVEARQPDDLDDLRVGDAADMGAQCEPA